MMTGDGDGSGKDKYIVGYKKPPEHSKFVKGKSGNPKGRPKKTKNLQSDMDEVLGEKITIREGERIRKVTKQRGVVLSLVAKALKGDARASSLVINAMGRMNPDSGLNPERSRTNEERGVIVDPSDPNYIPTDKPKELTSEEKFEFLCKFYDALKSVRGLPATARKAMFGVENGEEAEGDGTTNRDRDSTA
jgi:hypothetical protein